MKDRLTPKITMDPSKFMTRDMLPLPLPQPVDKPERKEATENFSFEMDEAGYFRKVQQ